MGNNLQKLLRVKTEFCGIAPFREYFSRYFFTQYGPANIPNWQLAKVFTFEKFTAIQCIADIHPDSIISLFLVSDDAPNGDVRLLGDSEDGREQWSIIIRVLAGLEYVLTRFTPVHGLLIRQLPTSYADNWGMREDLHTNRMGM